MPLEQGTQEITYDFTCTCGVADGDDDHKDDCQLYFCEEWMDGHATWYLGALWDTEELWGWGAGDEEVEIPLVEKSKVPQHGDDPRDLQFACDCFHPDDATITHASRHDAMCNIQEYDTWAKGDCEWDHDTRTFIYYERTPKQTKSAGFTAPSYGDDWYSGAAGAWKTCNHDGTKALEFPSGVKVYPSSSHDTKKRDSFPDHALYLETSRMPVSAATYIPWKDYGLPTISFHTAADIICEMYAKAADGLSIEIGCIGVHGRTGTVLACMAILSDVPVGEAVEWVRKNHCQSAVEGEQQRWFVEWFNAYVTGQPAPPTPPPPAPIPASPAKSYVDKALPFGATTGPKPTAKNGVDRGDLTAGDHCPACSAPLELFSKRVMCSSGTCTNYKGLMLCHECNVALDAQPREGYLCWNVHCKNFHIKASSPAAHKRAWKKGRKKK